MCAVDGILLLDKPCGLSSNAALQRARRLLDARKAGHTGTLDPLASGLLPLCFGEATKFAQGLLDAEKGYRATVRFGAATGTGDAEGEVIAVAPVDFDENGLRGALARFVGRIAQVPPRHAALKLAGRAYYDYARAGIDIPRAPREICVHSMALVSWAPPDAVIDIVCSKGTYVRVLAEDLGEALASRAHLAGLRRTRSGAFTIDAAVTLEGLERMEPPDRAARLLPVDAAIAAMPVLPLEAAAAAALLHGQHPSHAAEPGRYRAYGADGFVGVVEATGTSLRAVRLLATTRASAAPAPPASGPPPTPGSPP
jgi:tRNA pseudouridine55 synthase